MANFPAILAYLRKSKGLTQQELSKILGLSSSAVSMYENGNREPNFETLEAMADFFNVDMNYLMSGVHGSDIAPLINDDPELTNYLEELRTRPEMRMLFSVAKDATKEDVEKAVAIIEALRKTEGK